MGKKIDFQHENFQQFEILPVEDLARQIQAADIVVSRAGSNSLAEIIAAHKKCIAIPLPSSARNHQFLNAQFYEQKGVCRILKQNEATSVQLMEVIEGVLADEEMSHALEALDLQNASQTIARSMLEKDTH